MLIDQAERCIARTIGWTAVAFLFVLRYSAIGAAGYIIQHFVRKYW